MAITFIGSHSALATSVALTNQIGDLIVVAAYRTGTTALATRPGTYTAIGGGSAASSGNAGSTNLTLTLGWRIATAANESTGTWTNATAIVAMVFRGARGIGAVQTLGATATAAFVRYPRAALQTRPGAWWGAFAGRLLASATTDLATSPDDTGSVLTNRISAGSPPRLVGHAGPAEAHWAQTDIALGGTAAKYASVVFEVLSANLSQTDVRWRNDDGTESTATWAEAVNTGISVEVGQRRRVRAEVQGNAPENAPLRLAWEYHPAPSGQLAPIPVALPIGVPVYEAVFSPNGQLLAVAHDIDLLNANHSVSVLQVGTWEVVAQLEVAGNARCVAWSANGQRLAVGTTSAPYLYVFNTTTWVADTGIPNPGNIVNGVAWRPDGAFLAVAKAGNPNLIVYNTSTWGTVTVPSRTASADNVVRFSPDGTRLAVGGFATPTLLVLNTANWSTITVPTIGTTVYGLAFSPDGSLLAVGGSGVTILTTSPWATTTGPNTTPLTTTAFSVAWSPDTAHLTVGTLQSPFHLLYETATWARNTALPVIGGDVRSVAYSPSTPYLAIGGQIAPFLTVLDTRPWGPVPAQGTPSVPLRFANSPNLTDAAATSAQLGATSGFTAGRIYESNHTSTIAASSTLRTEVEAVVELVSGVADPTIPYQLRVVEDE